MKRLIAALLFSLTLVSTAGAADSLGFGVRAGADTGHSGSYTEVFGDLYLNRLVSIGATLAYVVVDRDRPSSLKRDESVPVTALFKLHAPVPYLQPYAGLGAALVFHDRRGTKGTPVALVGADLKLGPTPFFVNAEYRRQFDDRLDILAGGIGVRF
jgi:hypothetical protein